MFILSPRQWRSHTNGHHTAQACFLYFEAGWKHVTSSKPISISLTFLNNPPPRLCLISSSEERDPVPIGPVATLDPYPKTNPLHTTNPHDKRWSKPSNIIIFGEQGIGKSSVVNLIAGQHLAATDTSTSLSGNVFQASSYDVYLTDSDHRHHFNLFETAGLSTLLSVTQYLHAIARLHELISELSRTGGVRLLICCIRGGRITHAMQQNYILFHDAFCHRQVPVAFVVTGLENESRMDDWMDTNGYDITKQGLAYTAHACITSNFSLAYTPKYRESQQKLRKMLIDIRTGDSWDFEPSLWLEATAEKLLKWLQPTRPTGRRLWPVRRSTQPRERLIHTLTNSGFTQDGAKRLVSMILRDGSWDDGYTSGPGGGPQPSRVPSPPLPERGLPELLPTQPSPQETQSQLPEGWQSELPLSESLLFGSPLPGCQPHGIHTSTMHPSRMTTLFSTPDVTDQIVERPSQPHDGGGFSDIWKCGVKRANTLECAAVKCLRAFGCPEAEIERRNKRLRHEVIVWEKLDHRNILPLWGLASGFGPMLAMVCPWAENGALAKYLERLQHELTLERRFSLLCDIAAGLQYLHLQRVVHGDLTGMNILINSDGSACIADFGLSIILAEFIGSSYLTSTRCSVRWADPELYSVSPNADTSSLCSHFTDTPPSPSTRNDIYSFGSVMLQVLTGQVPYHSLLRLEQVLLRVARGESPKRPKAPVEIEDAHWNFIQQCWTPHDATQGRRPSVDEIVDFVNSERHRLTDT
ncbi:hypothetical protein HYDPIDRAFT_25548 [Hydnomerulius pinastri MD-312]|nr:hypothetical protein HYDPIDRAFT_25548 [Hydnomerulius pinastri MD-312]